jgi:putative sporulation protein YyaC
MNLKKGFFERKAEPYRVLHDDEKAAASISAELLTMLPTTMRPVVIVCIGTDRSTGDSLGPLVGTFLEEKVTDGLHIYGTLDDPIHAVNLEEKLEEIRKSHLNPFIIGIDACLGRLKSVGAIQLGEGPVKPGAGVNKELPDVGDMHITGIVNVSGFMEFFVLQNTRLNLVLKMARIISEGIYLASKARPRKESFFKMNLNEEKQQLL